MDNYIYSPVALDGGLDFLTGKISAEPGSLVDCLNVEVTDRSGYKRIDGIEPYDGREGLGNDQSRYLEVTGSGSFTINPGNILINTSDSNKEVGVITHYTTTALGGGVFMNGISFILTGAMPALTDLLAELSVPGDTRAVSLLPATNLASYIQSTTAVRALIDALPSVAIGLHWFRDTLYAFVDEDVIHFNNGSVELFINDHISTSEGTGTIIDIQVTNTDWAGGNAAGAILVSRTSAFYMGGGGATDIDVDRPIAGVQIAATIAAGTTVAWKAGIWKALNVAQAAEAVLDVGWNKTNTGVIVEFEDGNIVTGEYPKINRRTNEINIEYGTEETDVTGTNGISAQSYSGFLFPGELAHSVNTGVSYVGGAGPTSFHDAVAAAEGYGGSGKLLQLSATGTDGGFTKTTPRVGLTGINTVAGIPGYAIIKGIEVFIDGFRINSGANEAAGNNYFEAEVAVSLFNYSSSQPIMLGGEKTTSKTTQNGGDATPADVTMGGADDLWGSSSLTLEDVVNANFGVSLKANVVHYSGADSIGATENDTIQIDRIRVKVYYEKQFTRYYFWNPTDADDVQADMIEYRVWDGDLRLGSGVGVMQFVNLEEATGASRRSIKVGDEIHVATGGGAGSLVGAVTAVKPNSPASFSSLQTANSKYQFITSNFYGDEDWDAFYGVSGAGRAMSYDGRYFVTIYTQEDDDKDMPRHIAAHHYHLALGFSSGSVQVSVVGEPELFDGFLGSKEYGIGDRIVGLLSMRGATLGVFCERSIWGLVGTTVDNITTTVLAPGTGAVEYTVVDIGIPVYCDNRGIATLSQSDKYGDFLGSRLSFKITSWLQRRLRKEGALQGVSIANGIVGAIPFRGSNQYKVFFKDGYVLTMTLVGGEMVPQFTFQQYYIGMDSFSETDKYLVPLAWSSEVDDSGVDKIHVSHYSPTSAISEADAQYVYEMNSGWGFAGKYIPHYLSTNWNYNQSPMMQKIVRKVLLEGLTYGKAGLLIDVASDLKTNAQGFGSYSEVPVEISLPPAEDVVDIFPDYVASSNISSLASRGRTFSIKIYGDPEGANEAEQLANIEPSHVCQVLVLGFTSSGYIVK